MLSLMKTSKSQHSIREVFGNNLRLARRLKDMSQEELALRSELSRTYVSEVERGVRNVSIDNMEVLSIAIGVPLSDLVNPEMFSMIKTRLAS